MSTAETDAACLSIATSAYRNSDTRRTLGGSLVSERATSAIAEGLRRFTAGDSLEVRHAAAARMADLYYVSVFGKHRVLFSAAAHRAVEWAREHVASGGRVVL